MRVSDKVFVVTGVGNGIGREVVLALLARGAGVAAVDLSASGLAETGRLALEAQDRLTTHILNITDRAAVRRLPGEIAAGTARSTACSTSRASCSCSRGYMT